MFNIFEDPAKPFAQQTTIDGPFQGLTL